MFKVGQDHLSIVTDAGMGEWEDVGVRRFVVDQICLRTVTTSGGELLQSGRFQKLDSVSRSEDVRVL